MITDSLLDRSAALAEVPAEEAAEEAEEEEAARAPPRRNCRVWPGSSSIQPMSINDTWNRCRKKNSVKTR